MTSYKISGIVQKCFQKGSQLCAFLNIINPRAIISVMGYKKMSLSMDDIFLPLDINFRDDS